MTGIKEVVKVDEKRFFGKDGTRKLKVSRDSILSDCVRGFWTALCE